MDAISIIEESEMPLDLKAGRREGYDLRSKEISVWGKVL